MCPENKSWVKGIATWFYTITVVYLLSVSLLKNLAKTISKQSFLCNLQRHSNLLTEISKQK